MYNTHPGQHKSKEKRNKEYGKEEKRLPKFKIVNLATNPQVILDDQTNANIEENVGSFTTSIADKVKLRKRGRGSTSDGELFKTISQSSLPLKRRRTYHLSSVSSNIVSSSSVSSSPASSSPASSSPASSSPASSSPASSSPVSVPTSSPSAPFKAMFESDCDKSPIPSWTSEVKTETLPVYLHSCLEYLSQNSELYSTFAEAAVKNSNELPSKKAKLLENYPLVNEEKQTVTSSVVDIHQLEVASYEEVPGFEPDYMSNPGFPPEYFGINDSAIVVPATNGVQGFNSSSLPENEEKPLLNTEEANLFLSRVFCNILEEADVSLLHHDYPMTINNSTLKELDSLNNSSLQEIDPLDLEKFFKHLEELSLANKSSYESIDKMVDIVMEIEKQPDCQGFSSKVKDSTVVLSTVKHSTLKRDVQNITSPKNGTDSVKEMEESIKIIKRYLGAPGYAASSKTQVRDYRNTHDNNGVLRQENYTTKEKRKSMGERCIVYVGNIPHDFSEEELRERFQKFGNITDIQIKSKRCALNSSNGHLFRAQEIRNFGFITFSCNQEASDAIERGNQNYKLKFHLSFGARRQFVGEQYKDLDGIVAKNENSMYKHNSRSSFLPQNKEDDDFDVILKNEMKARGVKPQPFRMKCKV